MSAISSFLIPDAPPPSRANAPRSRPDASATAGQPTRFADFLNANSATADDGEDKTAPVTHKIGSKADGDADDTAATPEDQAAGQPGNLLPTIAPPLPVTPPLTPETPVVATTGATGTVKAEATLPTVLRTMMTTDGSPPIAATRPDTGSEAPPAIDAQNLAAMDPATPALKAEAPAPKAESPAFRLVAMPPNATPEVAPRMNDLPALPGGPLSVTQPSQAAATLATLAMPRSDSAPLPAAAILPEASLTMAQPVSATLDHMLAATADTAPPVPLPGLPSGPLSVTQPVQATATLGMLAGALRGLSRGTAKDEDPRDGLTSAAPTAAIDPAALGATAQSRPVTATGAADQAPLDMTQQHWPQSMIARIDRMREDAATADTRIQLSPDALGGIAVSIRQDQGATHLHFTAEQAQTATLLSDAHATLARLAEDRGMRLGETAVSSGAAAGSDMGQSMRDQRPPAQQAPALPTRPRGADSILSGEEAAASAAAAPSTPYTLIA